MCIRDRVLGATYLSTPLNLVHRPAPGAALRAHAEPISVAQTICPGPEALGVADLTDSLTQVASVTAVAAPLASLPAGFAAGQGAGSLTLSGLPAGGAWDAPATVSYTHLRA